MGQGRWEGGVMDVISKEEEGQRVRCGFFVNFSIIDVDSVPIEPKPDIFISLLEL